MHTVFRFGGTGNEDIVEVYEREIKTLEDRVREPLKDCASFYRPKGMQKNSHRSS